MKTISGGVCAPQGYLAHGVHCGIRKNKTKNDLAMIVSSVPASAAAIYTQNKVKGAPLTVTKEHLQNGIARAVLCNSGNANTCNADGIEIANAMCELAAKALGIDAGDVIVASTGVIGQSLPLAPIEAGIPNLVAGLNENGSHKAVLGIMTTDTREKEVAVEFELNGKVCKMGGIAKGSGMIHPNMATMLVFLTTDCAIAPALLQKALKDTADATFNMISVDGDTSTNDMVSIMANGLAGNEAITCEGEDYTTFCKALTILMEGLCKAIAKDGEGATKLLTCEVSGGATLTEARVVAKSVICSSLFKAAMFGADANWGRVLCAIGYSGEDVDPTTIDVGFASAAGRIDVCKDGFGLPFSEEVAKKVLSEDEITVLVDLKRGAFAATAWGCDLTYDYVKINGDYRT